MRSIVSIGVAARHLKFGWFVIVLILFVCGSELKAQQQTLTLPSRFHFDGSSYVTLPNSPAIQPSSQVTITAWIKPDFTVSNVSDTILIKRDGCGFNRSYELSVIKTLQNYTPGTIFFAASNANTDDLISTAPVPNDGNFHHVAGTYDGTTTKIFLDGVLVGQGVHTGLISTTSDPAFIGIQGGCGDLAYADMDQIKIFNYAVPDNMIMSDTSGFALLKGGNSFIGNQIVNGTVTAASFLGNGSGLNGVTASSVSCAACVGNLQLGINYAGSTSQGGVATNALSAVQSNNATALGGIAASNYARSDVGNNFTGNQSIGGSVSASGNLSVAGTTIIGGGTPIVEHLSATFNPGLPALKPATCASANFTLTGVADGDTLGLGVPNARMTGGGTLIYSAWVSAADTVTLQACNVSANPQKTAGSGAIRVDDWKH